MRTATALALITIALAPATYGQDKEKPTAHSWVSPHPNEPSVRKWKNLPESLHHATFESPAMGVEVGYYIYLPPGYENDPDARFPVVYFLHGGRPGGESKMITMSPYIDTAIRAGDVPPTIYVFPNGGPMSWYNYPQKGEHAMGEDVFVQELLPHIDATYRTLGGAGGRALTGFSQGGRGTTRIMLKHPEKFSSFAPGGSGYEPEKRIADNGGAESENVVFAEGYNTWDLAEAFAARADEDRPDLPILLWVGDKGFNYEFNLKYRKFLASLGIPSEIIVQPDAGHDAKAIYDGFGNELMNFHHRHFKSNSSP